MVTAIKVTYLLINPFQFNVSFLYLMFRFISIEMEHQGLNGFTYIILGRMCCVVGLLLLQFLLLTALALNDLKTQQFCKIYFTNQKLETYWIHACQIWDRSLDLVPEYWLKPGQGSFQFTDMIKSLAFKNCHNSRTKMALTIMT